MNPARPQLVITFKLLKHLLFGILDLGFGIFDFGILGFYDFWILDFRILGLLFCFDFRTLGFLDFFGFVNCRFFLYFGMLGLLDFGFWSLNVDFGFYGFTILEFGIL